MPDRAPPSSLAAADPPRDPAAFYRALGGEVICGKSGKVRGVTLAALGARVGDAELAPLAGLPDLLKLDVSGTAVTDAGLAVVGQLSKLGELNVERTAVTDQSVATLLQLSKLKLLLLRGTGISEAGVLQLRQRMLATRIIIK